MSKNKGEANDVEENTWSIDLYVKSKVIVVKFKDFIKKVTLDDSFVEIRKTKFGSIVIELTDRDMRVVIVENGCSDEQLDEIYNRLVECHDEILKEEFGESNKNKIKETN